MHIKELPQKDRDQIARTTSRVLLAMLSDIHSGDPPEYRVAKGLAGGLISGTVTMEDAAPTVKVTYQWLASGDYVRKVICFAWPREDGQVSTLVHTYPIPRDEVPSLILKQPVGEEIQIDLG